MRRKERVGVSKSRRLFLSPEDYDTNLMEAYMRCDAGRLTGTADWPGAYTDQELAKIHEGMIKKVRKLKNSR